MQMCNMKLPNIHPLFVHTILFQILAEFSRKLKLSNLPFLPHTLYAASNERKTVQALRLRQCGTQRGTKHKCIMRGVAYRCRHCNPRRWGQEAGTGPASTTPTASPRPTRWRRRRSRSRSRKRRARAREPKRGSGRRRRRGPRANPSAAEKEEAEARPRRTPTGGEGCGPPRPMTPWEEEARLVRWPGGDDEAGGRNGRKSKIKPCQVGVGLFGGGVVN